MLRPSSSFDPTLRIDMLFKHIDAYDPESGAYLSQSGGRTSKAPKWFLYFADSKDADGNYKPYREWRHTFRAWTFKEALDHANKKLTALAAKGKVGRSVISPLYEVA
jgi:hypothetical protein